MRGGLLRKRINIQQRTETRDVFGAVTVTWTTLETRWGEIEPLAGQELVEAQQVAAKATVRIRMRHFAGLTPSHRLRYVTNG